MRSFLFFLLVAGVLSSCSKYQAALRSESPSEKYAFADSLYTIGKYKKALKLMEQIVPIYRGKPQAEDLMFQYANTFYQLEDYYLAGYQFDRFVTSYPQSDSAEVAAYKSAKSYYHLSPRHSLDQEETYTALAKLQEFVNTYPESTYRAEANEDVVELRQKLEKKDIDIAEQMLELGDYLGSFRPAIESFENFITDHPGSIYREQAAFGKLRATYLFAINSVPSLVKERLMEAKDEYNSFVTYYKEGAYGEEANQILEAINEGLAEQEPTS